MAEYIEREAALEICETEYQKRLKMLDYCGDTVAWNIGGEIKALPAADVAPVGWVSVKNRLPKPETEVLAACVRNGYCFICPAIYEDGTMLTQDSVWNWYELDSYGTYSEENDDYFVPEGWWENRQFTPDDVYNNPVDCAVTHWMPLPKPPKGARMDGDGDA